MHKDVAEVLNSIYGVLRVLKINVFTFFHSESQVILENCDFLFHI